MEDQGCVFMVFVIMVILIISLVCIGQGQQPAYHEFSQKELEDMIHNAQWFATTAFPDLSEIIDDHDLTVCFVSGDVDQALKDLAQKEGIIAEKAAGVWTSDDVTAGTFLITRNGIVMLIKKDQAISEGAIWEIYSHELRHISHHFHVTRSDLLKERSETETVNTLREEIRTSEEMVDGIKSFLDNKEAIDQLKDESYRARCIEQLHDALENEEALIRKYNKRLEVVQRKAALRSSALGHNVLAFLNISLALLRKYLTNEL